MSFDVCFSGLADTCRAAATESVRESAVVSDVRESVRSVLQGGARVARVAHNHEVVGASPAPATNLPTPVDCPASPKPAGACSRRSRQNRPGCLN